VNEQKINEFFGDAESTGFGTGWWSGVLAAFFGVLSFGGVLCLHFPQLLSSPERRPHYPMHAIRLLIQGLIIAALFFGVVSSILRKKKILALSGMLLACAAAALGGSSVPIAQPPSCRWHGASPLDESGAVACRATSPSRAQVIVGPEAGIEPRQAPAGALRVQERRDTLLSASITAISRGQARPPGAIFSFVRPQRCRCRGACSQNRTAARAPVVRGARGGRPPLRAA
jgi:hypothetical protein